MYRFIMLFGSILLLVCSSCGIFGEGDDSLTVSLEEIEVQEDDVNKSVFVIAKLSKSSTETVTIFVESSDGTAESGVDFDPISTSVRFEPGVTEREIEVEIFGDNESEMNEYFQLEITNVSGASLGTSLVKITIGNDDGGSGFIPTTGYSTPENYDGMTKIWSQEFDGSSIDESQWTFELGNGDWGWGNNELQYYKKENASVSDGHLIIQAREEDFGGFGYTSTRMKTQEKFTFTFGRVDIRAALPEGQGIWPALWMLGSNITSVGWPRCGEIDIMEIVGHRPGTLHGTVHYADSSGGRLLSGGETTLSSNAKFAENFHVFSLIWEEDKITWLLDDVEYHSVSRGGLGINNPYPFNEDFFFIFNVAVGGQWPGSPDASTVFPQQMAVDYIRVFQEN